MTTIKQRTEQMVAELGIKQWRIVGGDLEYLDEGEGCTGLWWRIDRGLALEAFEEASDYDDWCALTEDDVEEVA